MNKSSSIPGDNYTTRERTILGRYTKEGKLRYRDLEAGYCIACESVYGVECPNCGSRAGDHLRVDATLFKVERPLTTDRFQGQAWTSVECAKCSYGFKVLVQPLH